MQRTLSLSLITGMITTLLLPLSALAEEPPVSYVTRAEAAVLILKNSRRIVDKTVHRYNPYPDVIDGEPETPYVLTAIELGMLVPEGKAENIYPLKSVSHIDFLRMMAIAFPLELNLPYKYADVPLNAPYRPYVGVAYTYKLFVNENDPSLLIPFKRVTDMEAGQTIYKMISQLPDITVGNTVLANRSSSAAPLFYSAPEVVTLPVVTAPEVVAPITQPTPAPSYPIYTTYSIPPAFPSAPVEVPVSTEPSLIVTPSTPGLVKSALLKLVQGQSNSALTLKTEVVQLVNAERAVYKLPPLKENYYLEKAAQAHAKDMYDRGYFSHYTPEGKSYVDRIRSAGYLTVNPSACSCSQTFTLGVNTENILDSGPTHQTIGTEECSCTPIYALGENIARGQITAREVVEDWMASASHRENILRSSFDEIGIGIFGDVWVQEFGKLKFQ